MRSATRAVPTDHTQENRRINGSALLTGAVSGAVAGVLGFDPLGMGLLVGSASWLVGKARQLGR